MSQTESRGPAERLLEYVRPLGRCVVAFSGGVDSAVVAAAAYRALGQDALAVTATSPSLADGELANARRVAAEVGIPHQVMVTRELDRPGYQRNDGQRCFYCKDELYAGLAALAAEGGYAAILNGTNADDLGDYRPGLRAAEKWRVLSPLVACDIDKSGVRAIARQWSLSVAEKPAGPCLASRLAIGQQVTPERLERVDRAERALRELGFESVRVRLHDGELARIEVPLDGLARLAEPALRQEIARHFRELGFRYVTLDLEGFRSGSLNPDVPPQLVSIDDLESASHPTRS